MKIFLLMFVVFSFPAYAVVCVENNITKCAALGYDKSSCPDNGIACPFDPTKWHCAEWTCADGRYQNQPESGKICTDVIYKGLHCYECSKSE